MHPQNNTINVLFLGLLLLCISCKKNNTDAPEKPAEPIRTVRGQTIGTATKVIIGSNGGSISVPDQYISIKVPAGAVDASTEFSIQEVEPNTAVGTGRLFRILPEGIILKKPVEITFRYTAADLAGDTENYLYPCFQSDDGLWHKVTDCTLDKTTRTLKVTTTHFSDWSFFREVSIYASKPEIGANEEVDLEAFIIDSYKENEASAELLQRGSSLKPEQIVEWKVVYGGGTISGGKNPKIKYKAPNTDRKMEVMIEVTAKNVVKQSDPARPGNGGLVITRRTLTILPEEYVTWTINGEKHTGIFFSIAVFDGEAIMTATAPNSAVSFHASGTTLGKYSFGKLTEPKKATLAGSSANVTYESEYTECVTFKKVYGEGFIIFETFGESGGALVQGTFQGILYNLKACEVSARSITGAFRIRRTY